MQAWWNILCWRLEATVCSNDLTYFKIHKLCLKEKKCLVEEVVLF